MSDFIRVPRAFKKRSKRSVLDVNVTRKDSCSEMGRSSVKEKEKKSFKRGSIKERWLLTRKTWKYMTDAGRRLLPEGVGNKTEDIPKIEQYFQEVCRNEPVWLMWRRKCSYPGAGPVPRRRKWKSRFGTVSPKKASSADEAEDECVDDLHQVQLVIDMLKNYLDIRDDDDEHDPSCTISSSTSMISLDTATSLTNTTAKMGRDSRSTEGATAHGNVWSKTTSGQYHPSMTASKSPLHQSASSKSSSVGIGAHSTPFSLFTSSRDTSSGNVAAAANLTRFRHTFSIMDKITPAMLNDKVALRKIYEQLRASQKLNQLLATNTSSMKNARLNYPSKTFAFSELSGKYRGLFKNLPKPSDGSTSSMFLRHYDTASSNTPSSSLCGIDERSGDPLATPRRPERRIYSIQNETQTEAIPLRILNELSAEYKKQLEQEEALMREEEMAQFGGDPTSTRHDRRNSGEDVSQSVSDTIKRYLRMARKKPSKEDPNRFKRINYDRNLRNIKAKGEITKIGDDDGNCKGCQTDDDWILKSFEDLAQRAATAPAVRPTTLPARPSTGKQGATPTTPGGSTPSSPGGIITSGSHIFHTSTQFLSNLFGHTSAAATAGGGGGVESSSNDIFYGSPDAAMQKSKSSSNIVSRKIWKSRSKSQSRPTVPIQPMWTPQGNCVWVSSHGHVIKLKESALYELTEVERKILYRLAIGKIKQFDLDISPEWLVNNSEGITSRPSTKKPAKRKALLIKRKALTTGFFDSSKDDTKSSSRGRIFGVSLEQSMENEVRKDSCAPSPTTNTKADRRARNSLSSLMDPNATFRCSGSCESLPSKSQQSDNGLLKSKGSLSQFDVRRNSQDDEDDSQLEGLERTDRLQVPALVATCVQHLEKHGLNCVGLFRKSTSKKRVRQLREDFDNGDALLDDDTCPHDVATLLKEYLRDLPEPLLCRRLYQPFVSTQKIRNRRLQFEAISYLVQLLPIPHRDTLYYLLRFLAKVARFANDVQSSSGEVVYEGNKMDSNNLATVFAPNILHDAVTGQVTSDQEVCDRLDVINVIRIMIDHYEEMFRISAETIDEIFLNMMDGSPLQLNTLCDRMDTSRAQDSSDTSSQFSPTSPPPSSSSTTAQLMEANKQKREEFLRHQNSSKEDPQGYGFSRMTGNASRRPGRDGSDNETSARRAGPESSEDIFSRRRMSSPYFFNNVLTGSLKIPVQMSSVNDEIANIPFIEDNSYGPEYSPSSLESGSRRTSGHVIQAIDSRKSSSSGTVTGTLSLVQSPISPASSNSTSMFFGDDDVCTYESPQKGKSERVTAAGSRSKVTSPDNDLQKSKSLFSVGQPSSKKFFETKAPVRQKLTIHQPSNSNPVSQRADGDHKKSSPAISNIGGDLLRSKTADFERFLGQSNVEPRKKGPIYKRQEIISSARK